MKPASSRFRRRLIVVAGLIVLYAVIGFLVAPPVVKAQLGKRASAALGRQVTVEKVRLNPFALSLTLENFDIRTKDGDGSFMGWKRLYVNFSALASLTGGGWVIGEVDLAGFHGAVAVGPDGSLNFTDILAKFDQPAATEPAKPGRPLRVGSLKVDDARLEFADHSRAKPFSTQVGPLTFNVTGFHTGGGREAGAPYHFEAATEAGEKLAWSGTIGVQPLRSAGEFHLENFVIAKYAPYQPEFLRAHITRGNLSVDGKYEVDFSEAKRVLRLADGAVRVGDLQISELGDHPPAIDLPSLAITGIEADAVAQKASVDAVTIAGGQVRLRREKDGAINLLAMISPAAEAPAGAPAATAAPSNAAPTSAPEIRIGEVSVKDFELELNDLAAARPAELALTGIGFSLKDATLADGAVMPLHLAFGLASQGAVQVDGTVSVKPALKADLKTEVTGLALPPLSPYLEQFVNARVTQGAVTTRLAVTAEMPAGEPFAATAAGEVQVEKLALVDGVKKEKLAGVDGLRLKGLTVTTAPRLAVVLDEVEIAGPYARVSVAADKTLNLAALAKTEGKPASESAPPPVKAAPSTPESTPASAPAPKVEIARVVVSAGNFSFADQSIEPHVTTAITDFAGTISGLSSENPARGTVDLKATVDGAAPIAITGQLDPLGAKKYVDLKIDVKNMDLLPLSPYSGRYAGYELARGKLMLDVKFLLDGRKIASSDVITLNQFNFGEATGSPEATGLPVRLGVALLKDTEGKIVIDVPIEGNLDDPSFRIGRVVLRVIVNLLTKVATSPFSLLGSMFGGGGDELAYQEFSAGAAELQPAEIKKLETMVKALTNRPALSVSLEGSYDGPADTFALKREKLADTVRRAVWERKHEVSPDLPPPEALVVTPEESAAAVKQLYDGKFPPGTEFGAPLAKAPEPVKAPPPPRKGFLGRVVDVITLKDRRKEKPAEAEKPVETNPADVVVATGPSPEEMTGRLAETMEVTDNDLRALAAARATAVRDYFINAGKIDPERLFLAKGPADPAKAAKGPRVFLTLQ